MIAYDLFSGAGCASQGLADAGFEVVGFDNWATACETHQANGHATVCCDLDVWPWRGACDLLWGSPPCQPFSASGDHEGVEDDRDGTPAFLRAVAELAPPIVVMENVPGLLYEKHAAYFGRVIRRLIVLGYRTDWRVLNCADYGIAQTRDRLIVIARNDGGALVWPTVTHTEGDSLFLERWVSMAEALGWDAGCAHGGAGNWHLTRPATTVAGDSRVWPPGHKENSDDPPGKFQQRRGENAIRITVEQAARLQDFPEGYIFKGTRTAQFQQIGNACPRTLVRVIVEALKGGGQ